MAVAQSHRTIGVLKLLESLPVSASDPETIAANYRMELEPTRKALERAADQSLVECRDGVYLLTEQGRNEIA